MKVSFVIPAYNEEDSIADCVRCIQGAIAHAPVDAEIIVVDNASTDKTWAIASAIPGVTMVREERQSLTQARKAGFEASTGDLIAQVDADNRMPKEWLQVALHLFERKPHVIALTGRAVYYDLPLITRLGILWVYYVGGYVFSWLVYLCTGRGTIFQGGNCIIKRDALTQAGGYNTDFPFYGEDVELGSRLQKVGKVSFRFDMRMLTSGRRLAAEGIWTMGVRYGLNYIWTVAFRKPYTSFAPAIRSHKARKSFVRWISTRRLLGLTAVAMFLAVSGGLGLAVHNYLEAEEAAASGGEMLP
jgi:glycosyltransferase involved in cell wall biosynthesis